MEVLPAYTSVGTGPVKVLLLPGLFGAHQAFDAMLAHADRERFQYVVMNYRGYGHARDVTGVYTLDEVVGDALSLLDLLDWPTVHVGGHSIGALIAQKLALAAPQRVRSVVSLAGMNARGASRDPARVKMLDDAAHDLDRRAALVDMGTGQRHGMALARQVAESGWHAIAPAACAGYVADAALTDISAEVAGSTLPVLVLVGAHDPGCSAAVARDTTLRWYPNATLEVFDEVGHYPMFEAPQRTLAVVEAFLRRLA